MSKWIEFSKPVPSKSGKTNIWSVYSSGSKEDEDDDRDMWLGDIKWRGAWRKYAFFPDRDTVFEADCMRDLAQFCEDKTKAHKEGTKK